MRQSSFFFFCFLTLFLFLCSPSGYSAPAKVSSLTPDQLQEFDSLSPEIQKILRIALDLTTKNLTYTYGSASPDNGGMDCSGTIHYILKAAGISNPPRQADTFYLWAEKNSRLHPVSAFSLDSPQFQHLKPGDLLFWSGTYPIKRKIPVTHVMIYLGKRKSDGKPVMVGASDGRPYDGSARNGVSVFDFRLPSKKSKSRFVGYAPIPNT